MTFSHQFKQAKIASRILAQKTSDQKNAVLLSLSHILEKNISDIITENTKDIRLFQKNGGSDSLTDRLLLDKKRILTIVSDVKNVALLPDSVGEILSTHTHQNGMQITQKRVPLGVIGMIYEARPNVTIDASILGLKSGNAMILKGGKEARNTNRILVSLLHKALEENQFPRDCLQFLDTDDRSAVTEMLHAKKYIDIIIPRGGKKLIDVVEQNSTVPVIQTGASVVHTYVDDSAHIPEAVAITLNEKFRRVSVCNALDTILVHQEIAQEFLQKFAESAEQYVHKNRTPILHIHADTASYKTLVPFCAKTLHHATPEDYHTEWLDYVLNIKQVISIDDALEHIQEHSLGHSESICSQDDNNIQRFLTEVDAACVYANSTTTFSDGMEFGLGAEIGISTQKLHVRGPFALQGLTSVKWVITGNGQIR